MTLSESATINPTGGVFGFGVISGVAVSTVGEAAGHSLWLDQVFVEQCAAIMAKAVNGLKCRFTHPSFFSDGLGTYLGKMTNPRVVGNQCVADLNFSEASTKGMLGNMAEYIMSMAKDTPEDLGLSVYGEYDCAAMQQFMIDNGAQPVLLADATEVLQGFQSPDQGNTQNFPHARLANLSSVDAVDEPASNPSGLFARFSAKNKEVSIMADLITAELKGEKKIGILAELATRKIALSAEVVNAAEETETSTTVITREETDTEVVYVTTEKDTVIRTERIKKDVPTEPQPEAEMSTKTQADAALSAVVDRLAKLESDAAMLKTENASMKTELAKNKFTSNSTPGAVPAAALATEAAPKRSCLASKIEAAAAALKKK